jgi:hypothetical protein
MGLTKAQKAYFCNEKRSIVKRRFRAKDHFFERKNTPKKDLILRQCKHKNKVKNDIENGLRFKVKMAPN